MLSVTYGMGAGIKHTTKIDYFTFAGGEVHLNFKLPIGATSPLTITANIRNSDTLMALMLLTDSLNRQVPEWPKHLIMDYLPYARQDRVCTAGDPFSLEVVSKMLKSCGFSSITVQDVHSQKALQQDLGLNVVSQLECLPKNVMKIALGNCVLVAPDAGAYKKTKEIADFFGNNNVSRAMKVRDTRTGMITGTHVDREDYEGKTCLIVDDICDGGRTFIELAKILKERNAGKVILSVTHGIFSKGKEPLYEYIDEVYATNDWTEE